MFFYFLSLLVYRQRYLSDGGTIIVLLLLYILPHEFLPKFQLSSQFPGLHLHYHNMAYSNSFRYLCLLHKFLGQIPVHNSINGNTHPFLLRRTYTMRLVHIQIHNTVAVSTVLIKIQLFQTLYHFHIGTICYSLRQYALVLLILPLQKFLPDLGFLSQKAA